MKRLLGMAGAVVLLAITVASGYAQDSKAVRRASRFDLGIFAGGAINSPWYESRLVFVDTTDTLGFVDNFDNNFDNNRSFSVRGAWVFGAQATFWFTRVWGVRAQGTYMPSRVPFLNNNDEFNDEFNDFDGRDVFFDRDRDHGPMSVNNWFYDLDIMARPFVMREDWSRNVYFFLGGGGLTTNVAGKGPGCEFRTLLRGACLPLDSKHASVGQGTLGVGADLIPLGRNFSVFAELGVRGYQSPVHVGDGWVVPIRELHLPAGTVVAVADDRFAWTGQLAAGIKLNLGNLIPPPPPPPPPPVTRPPPPPPPPATRAISVCVVEGQMLRNVEATYHPTSGDTTVSGRRFSEAFPAMAPTYVAGSTWFVNNDPIMFNGRRYVKFGLPRVIGVSDVMFAGAYQGTNIFVEAGTTGTPTIIYLPVRPGCEFQPYQAQAEIKVRG